jgi:RNA polymerase sigma-70 factor (sigma-E family)
VRRTFSSSSTFSSERSGTWKFRDLAVIRERPHGVLVREGCVRDGGVRLDRYEGFAEFVSARSVELMRIAYLLSGDRRDAEDLLQAALTKAAVRWPQLVGGNPEAYIRRILYTQVVSVWRYRRRRPEVPVSVVPERAGPDEAERVVRRVELVRLLGQLSARQRAVVVLRFYGDLSEAEVAEVLGCSVGSVKSHSGRALARLRELSPGLFATGTKEEVP